MKKIVLGLVTIFISLFAFSQVKAASANISVTSNKSRVIVGENVTVTVKISSSQALGSWSFDVVPSSNLTLVDSSFGGLYIADVVQNGNQKSKTYTFTFKAKSSGTGSVSIRNSNVRGWDELSMSATNGSTSFKMMTQSELQASYSKNNNLKSLSIEGYELTPTFDKDILEYTLELENGIESIEVSATKEDSTASISGTGTIPLSEGVNPVKIVVTAQNGSTKTYTINVTVKELSPIEVTVDGKKYSVIRKQEFMPAASIYYEETKVMIGEEEVPAYHNSHTDFTLVGLKDEEGNTGLFLYQNDTYLPYQELSFNQIAIYSLDLEEIPKGYIKDTITIGQNKVTAYTKEGSYPLVYGINLDTGIKRLYQYDQEENTLQRFKEVDNSKETLYFYCIIGLISFIILTYFIILIVMIKNNKKKKLKLERTMKLQALNHMKDEKKDEDILHQTMVNIGGVQKELNKKELKAQKKQEAKEAKMKEKEEQRKKEKEEEQAQLLGKTMMDITGIPFGNNEPVLSKKEQKKLDKQRKKQNKKESKEFLD